MFRIKSNIFELCKTILIESKQVQTEFVKAEINAEDSNSSFIYAGQPQSTTCMKQPTEKKKRRRHTTVKRPTTAYLYFVSRYREKLKENNERVPKVINYITQYREIYGAACMRYTVCEH